MINKKLKPTSAGLRHQIVMVKNTLCKNTSFLKKNTFCLKKTGGRSKQDGHITSWHRGGKTKKKTLITKKIEPSTFCICIAIIYSPVKNSFISINFNVINLKFNFGIHTDKQCIGGLIDSGLNNKFIGQKLGSILQMNSLYPGSIISAVSKNNKTYTYAKAAGTYCQIVQKYKNFVKLKLPSGRIIEITSKSWATLGSISNKNYNTCILGKAGKKSYKNKRSIVRGVAMNPVDHPHGGRTNGGRPSVSPWGKITKGVPTRKYK
jgi:large subunit ribosomal protein L2